MRNLAFNNYHHVYVSLPNVKTINSPVNKRKRYYKHLIVTKPSLEPMDLAR